MISIEKASNVLGLSINKLTRMSKHGRIPCYYDEDNNLLFKENEITTINEKSKRRYIK